MARSFVLPLGVDPLEAIPLPPLLRTMHYRGTTGSCYAILLRWCQFVFAVVCVLAMPEEFPSISAFRYLLGAVGLQSVWSTGFLVIDTYAFMRNIRISNPQWLTFFTFVDGATSTLTFSAASAAAGITVLISHDLEKCSVNYCGRLISATATAFLSSFAASTSFFLNFWTLGAATVA